MKYIFILFFTILYLFSSDININYTNKDSSQYTKKSNMYCDNIDLAINNIYKFTKRNKNQFNINTCKYSIYNNEELDTYSLLLHDRNITYNYVIYYIPPGILCPEFNTEDYYKMVNLNHLVFEKYIDDMFKLLKFPNKEKKEALNKTIFEELKNLYNLQE